jgi:hypothetical protein
MKVVQGDAGTAHRDEKCNPFMQERHQFLHKAKKTSTMSTEALSEATPATAYVTDTLKQQRQEREGTLAVARTNEGAARSVLLPTVIVLN